MTGKKQLQSVNTQYTILLKDKLYLTTLHMLPIIAFWTIFI